MNWRIVLAQHAAERAAVQMHWQMSWGLFGLATVAATAPFLGMVGAVMGIVYSFAGGSGEKSTMMAAVANGLSQALWPAAFGVAVATLASWGHKHLSAELEVFDSEMRNAVRAMPDYLRRLAEYQC